MGKYFKYILLFSFFSSLLFAVPPEVETVKCIHCEDSACTDLGSLINQEEQEYCTSLDESSTYVYTNALADNGNKCIVYKFGAPWCPPCLQLKGPLEKLMKAHPKISFNDYNIDKLDDEFKKKYNVKTIPKVIAWVKGEDGEYKNIFNHVGLKENSAQKTVDALEKALKDAGCILDEEDLAIAPETEPSLEIEYSYDNETDLATIPETETSPEIEYNYDDSIEEYVSIPSYEEDYSIDFY